MPRVANRAVFPEEAQPRDQWKVGELIYSASFGDRWWVGFCGVSVAEMDFVLTAMESNMFARGEERRHGDLVLVAMHRIAGPTYEGLDDRRRRIAVGLQPVVSGVAFPTDVRFHASVPEVMYVSEKGGALRACPLGTRQCVTIVTFDVFHDGELGLLGFDFHPEFARNRRIVVSYNARLADGSVVHRIAEIGLGANGLAMSSGAERRILEEPQKTLRHTAGQVAFGPDGFLYAAFGDDDGLSVRSLETLQGKLIRIDIDHQDPSSPYAVPPTNPFVGRRSVRPEIWAWGFRNPWRFSFSPEGRLWLADVGAGLTEEVNVVEAGRDYGWDMKEGRACTPAFPRCDQTPDLAEPAYTYGREDGNAIIGGYVHSSADSPGLRGKYLFGDGVTGRLWALEGREVFSLGRWPLFITTFGRDERGRVYVAGLGGTVYRIEEWASP